MLAYSYDDTMTYIGTTECQPDPVCSRREGSPVYLLPANATFTAPPDFDPETQKAVWYGEAWVIEQLPEPEPAPEPPETEPTDTEVLNTLLGVTE